MPTSDLHQLNEIVELIVVTDPKSVLDVGVGFGKYGFLSREYLELWDGRQEYSDWKRQIDGIEVFRGYLTPVHDFIYNHIYVGNATEVIPTLKTKYDLILLIDILEHFDCEEGAELLNDCQKVARNILVSTPRRMGCQKDSFGNPYEAHKCQWRKEHFNQFEKKFFVRNEGSLICYIGEDALAVKMDVRRVRIKRRIRLLFPFLKHPYRLAKRLSNPLPGTRVCRVTSGNDDFV